MQTLEAIVEAGDFDTDISEQDWLDWYNTAHDVHTLIQKLSWRVPDKPKLPPKRKGVIIDPKDLPLSPSNQKGASALSSGKAAKS